MVDWAAGLSPTQKATVQQVVVMAEWFFRDEKALMQWFGAPNYHLEGRAPENCLFEPNDDDSRQEVHDLLALMCAMCKNGRLGARAMKDRYAQ